MFSSLMKNCKHHCIYERVGDEILYKKDSMQVFRENKFDIITKQATDFFPHGKSAPGTLTS